MAQRPKTLNPHASARHYWGSELRALRENNRMSLQALGEAVHRDRSALARVERGERGVTREFAQDCDRALGANGTLVRLYELVAQDATPSGVIQGPDTGGHVANPAPHVANPAPHMASPHEEPRSWETDGEVTLPARTDSGEVIFVSISRRRLLTSMGATALGAAVGAPTVLSSIPDANPIEHFDEMRRVLMDADNLWGPSRVVGTVTQQIEIMQQLRQHWRGREGTALTGIQTQFADLASWMHQDSRDYTASRYWLDRALEWSHMGGAPDITAFILARRSQLAADMGDPGDAVDAATAAVDLAQYGRRSKAVAATFEGHGHAMLGDEVESKRAFDRAQELLEEMAPDDPSPYGLFFNQGYLDVQRGHALIALGEHATAATTFQLALSQLPPGFHRDRGTYLAWEALAHVGASDTEQAADRGTKALAIANETGSARVLTELGKLDQSLMQWQRSPEVGAFREQFAQSIPEARKGQA